MSLQEIMKEIKALTPDEQRQLRKFLDKLLKISTSTSKSTKVELERKLLEAGLISESKPLIVDIERYRSYKPVKVRGKPVSETIVEERR